MPNRPLFAIVLFLATVLIFTFLIWPNYQEFRRFSLDIKSAKTELSYLEEYYSDLEQIKAQLDQYQDILEKIDFSIPDTFSLPEFFNYLQMSSNNNGLILTDIGKASSYEAKDKSGLKAVTVQPSLKGTYPAFKNFLASLYRNSKLIELDSVAFSAPKEGNIFDFKILVRTHGY